MNCSPFDLRDYWLEELRPEETRQVETHVAGCQNCREELERLRLTRQALLRLREEEPPRRIAFVSDKVFEPSRAARWWSAVWGGAPKLAFGLAMLLAVFFAGAWAARPSVTVENGRWQVAFGGQPRASEAVAAMEARHAAEMRNVEQTYELLIKQMNELYRRQAEMAPALYRQ
jgi:anti-sigma factor RsiW